MARNSQRRWTEPTSWSRIRRYGVRPRPLCLVSLTWVIADVRLVPNRTPICGLVAVIVAVKTHAGNPRNERLEKLFRRFCDTPSDSLTYIFRVEPSPQKQNSFEPRCTRRRSSVRFSGFRGLEHLLQSKICPNEFPGHIIIVWSVSPKSSVSGGLLNSRSQFTCVIWQGLGSQRAAVI
jgi:hypothetical protein